MRRPRALAPLVVLAIAIATIVATVGAETGPAADAPAARFELSKMRHLSTESATGLLVIDNPTANALTVSPLSIFFSVRDADGSRHEEGFIRVISHPPVPISIPAKTRKTVAISLPPCVVVSDPCSMDVFVKLTVSGPEGRSVPLETQSVSDTFVADPEATYRDNASRQTTPIFLVQGRASGSIYRRHPQVRFHVVASGDAESITAKEADVIAKAFANFGLDANTNVSRDDAGIDFTVDLTDDAKDAAIVAATSKVLRTSGAGATSTSLRYTGDKDDFDRIATIAEADARRAATALAAFWGAGPLDRGTIREDTQYVSDDSASRRFDESDLMSERGDASSPTREVVVATSFASDAFVAETAVTHEASRTLDGRGLEYFGNDADVPSGWSIRLTVAADRPEIYALAQTTTDEADARGYSAQAVATSLADARAHALALELGTSAGPLTLAVAYAPYDVSQGAKAVAGGVALSPSNGLDSSVSRYNPAPAPTPLPRDASMHPVAVTPTPTPHPPFPSNRSAQSPLDVVPIAVPADDTRVTVRADVPYVAAHAQIVEHVAFMGTKGRRDVRHEAGPDLTAIERDLQTSHLADVATTAEERAGSTPSYRVTVDSKDPRVAQNVANALIRAYARSPFRPKITISPPVWDCEMLALRALHLSFETASGEGYIQAEKSGRPLRHLILAVAGLPSVDRASACNATEHGIGAGPLTVHSPVELTFRTR